MPFSFGRGHERTNVLEGREEIQQKVERPFTILGRPLIVSLTAGYVLSETNGDAQMVLLTPQIPDCPLNQFQVHFFNKDKSDGPDARWVSTQCVENLSTKGPSPGLKLIRPKHGGVVRQYSMVAQGNFELSAGQWRFSSQTEAGATLAVTTLHPACKH